MQHFHLLVLFSLAGVEAIGGATGAIAMTMVHDWELRNVLWIGRVEVGWFVWNVESWREVSLDEVVSCEKKKTEAKQVAAQSVTPPSVHF